MSECTISALMSSLRISRTAHTTFRLQKWADKRGTTHIHCCSFSRHNTKLPQGNIPISTLLQEPYTQEWVTCKSWVCHALHLIIASVTDYRDKPIVHLCQSCIRWIQSNTTIACNRILQLVLRMRTCIHAKVTSPCCNLQSCIMHHMISATSFPLASPPAGHRRTYVEHIFSMGRSFTRALIMVVTMIAIAIAPRAQGKWMHGCICTYKINVQILYMQIRAAIRLNDQACKHWLYCHTSTILALRYGESTSKLPWANASFTTVVATKCSACVLITCPWP